MMMSKAPLPQGIRAVVAAALGNMVCLNVTISSVFGVFLIPIAKDLGWPRAQVTGVLALIALVSVLSYPIVGYLIDRFGGRRVILSGAILFAFSVASLRLTGSEPWSFYAHFALIGATGAAPSTAMLSKVIADWFDGNRGLMLGLAAGVGNGVGATVMPLLAAHMLGLYDWRTCYAIIGMIVFVVSVPAFVWGIKDAPGGVQTRQVTETSEKLMPVVKTANFWRILSSIGLVAGGLTAIFSHVVPLLRDRGFDLPLSGAVMAVMALSAAVGQVGAGALLDRFSTPRMVIPFLVLAIAAIAGLQWAKDPAVLMASAVCLGVSLGLSYAALPYFISRYFGLAFFGRIAGLMYAAVMLSQGLTPFLMDLWFDHTGSYRGAVMILAVVLAVASLIVAFLPPYREKVSSLRIAIEGGHFGP